MEERGFTSFLCEHCHTEIEASPDMIGESAECPACGAKLIIPDNRDDGVTRHAAGDVNPERDQALKSRTIRIELDDL